MFRHIVVLAHCMAPYEKGGTAAQPEQGTPPASLGGSERLVEIGFEILHIL
jgi:hypothetical protein